MPSHLIPFALLAASVASIGWLSLAPMPGRPIAAVFLPWWNSVRTFGASTSVGADIVWLGEPPRAELHRASYPPNLTLRSPSTAARRE
jgi:hypothetical protein